MATVYTISEHRGAHGLEFYVLSPSGIICVCPQREKAERIAYCLAIVEESEETDQRMAG